MFFCSDVTVVRLLKPPSRSSGEHVVHLVARLSELAVNNRHALAGRIGKLGYRHRWSSIPSALPVARPAGGANTRRVTGPAGL